MGNSAVPCQVIKSKTSGVKDALLKFLPEVAENEPMSRHTSFKIGGPADLLITPSTQDEIRLAISVLKDAGMPYYIIGNGSNLLVKDGGIRGCVIKLVNNFNRITRHGCDVYAEAGANMWQLAHKCVEFGLGGMEFASGIPGTVGGTVSMNAGAYEHEMKDIIKSVRVLAENGEILEVDNKDMQFGYRHSIACEKNWIILGATLGLEDCPCDDIAYKIEDFTRRRRSRQPLNYASAGSAFKRPPGHFAAKLIDDAGLKGVTVGAAQVSELHSGFIINLGEATAKDVLGLMELVQKTVYEKYGVSLVPEVKIIGED